MQTCPPSPGSHPDERCPRTGVLLCSVPVLIKEKPLTKIIFGKGHSTTSTLDSTATRDKTPAEQVLPAPCTRAWRQKTGLVPLKETQTCIDLFSPSYFQKAYGKETRARHRDNVLAVSSQGPICSSGDMLYAREIEISISDTFKSKTMSTHTSLEHLWHQPSKCWIFWDPKKV